MPVSPRVWKFKGIARVGDEIACEAELMCTMRYVGPDKQDKQA